MRPKQVGKILEGTPPALWLVSQGIEFSLFATCFIWSLSLRLYCILFLFSFPADWHGTLERGFAFLRSGGKPRWLDWTEGRTAGQTDRTATCTGTVNKRAHPIWFYITDPKRHTDASRMLQMGCKQAVHTLTYLTHNSIWSEI